MKYRKKHSLKIFSTCFRKAREAASVSAAAALCSGSGSAGGRAAASAAAGTGAGGDAGDGIGAVGGSRRQTSHRKRQCAFKKTYLWPICDWKKVFPWNMMSNSPNLFDFARGLTRPFQIYPHPPEWSRLNDINKFLKGPSVRGNLGHFESPSQIRLFENGFF